MKKKKIVAIIISFVLAFGLFNWSNIDFKGANASEILEYGTLLKIKNIDEEFDIAGNNNKLVYKDYCETGAEVIVYDPTGNFETSWTTITEDNSYVFRTAGLYGVQFRKNNGSGLYTYSNVYYISVSASFGEIMLDRVCYDDVQPNTVVVIPKAVNRDGSDDANTHIHVYTPYGESFSSLMQNLETGCYNFTNKEGVLGTYFIEYTKSVYINGTERLMYKYVTIDFDNSSENTTSTKELITFSQQEHRLNITPTGLGLDSYLYLYKYYKLQDAVVENPDGTINGSAVINLSIYNKTQEKYYSFTTKEFDQEIENIVDISTIAEDFVISSVKGVPSSEGTGDEIIFKFTSVLSGEYDLTKEVKLSEKFNASAISVKTNGVNASEVTGLVISDEEVVVPASVNINSAELKVQDGYDKNGLKALVESVRITTTESIESRVYSSNEELTGGIGVKLNGFVSDDPLTRTATIYYDNQATNTYNIVVSYDVIFASDENVDFTFISSYNYDMHVLKDTNDNSRPSTITISSFDYLIDNGQFVVPNATAVDLDNSKKVTTGVDFVVKIVGESSSTYPVETVVQIGEKLTLLPSNYTITYIATDSCGNSTRKQIGFKVVDNTADSFPTITEPTGTFNRDDKQIGVEFSSTVAENVIIFESSGKIFSPQITMQNGQVKSFAFEYSDLYGYSASLVNQNSYGTTYMAIKLSDSFVMGKLQNEFATKSLKTDTIGITPSTKKEVNVGDTIVWLGNKNFTIESSEGGLFEIKRNNEIKFLNSGTYTIKSNEKVYEMQMEATTIIEVVDTYSTIKFDEFIGAKRVAKKGETVQIVRPDVINCFNYEYDVVVKNSCGNVVASGNITSFVADKVDVYTVCYKFRARNCDEKTYSYTVSTGNINAPTISILSTNKNAVWTGENLKYQISNAVSLDKNGKPATILVNCYDGNGKSYEVTNENGNLYVTVKDAGIYTLYYIATDSDGIQTVVMSNFAVEFPQESDKGLSTFAIIGIVLGSIVGASIISFGVYLAIKNIKKKGKFINKNRQTKKQDKKEQSEKVMLYTVAELKDGKHWVVKKMNSQIAKCLTKTEAIDKAKEDAKTNSNFVIKIYNQNGRLIDSI